MKIKNSFVKKSVIYFIGTLSSRLLNVLLVPIYAYYVLPADLGNYDYVTSIGNIAMPIVFLAIWESILRYCLKEKDETNQDIFLSNALFFFLFMTIIVAIAVPVACLFFKDTSFVVGGASFLVVSGAVYIWQFSARSLGESKTYVKAGLIGSGVLILSDLCFILFYKLDYAGLLISYIISQIAIILVIEIKVRLFSRLRKKNVSKKVFIRMIKFSVPLVINNISLWFYTGGNKVIIQNYLGASENGLYSFASRFSLLISLFSTVISMAVIEESYSFSTLEEYKTKISKLIIIISKAYFSLITLALPAIYILYSLAFKRSVYYPSQDYIFLLLLASLFTALSNNFGSAFQVTDKTQYIVVTTIIGAAASIGVSLILVGSLGIYGVLLGGAIGPFLMMLSRAIFAKRATNLKINWLNNILIFGVGCVFYIGLRVNKSILIQFTILFIAMLFTIFQYRSELFELKSRLERKRG